MLEGVVTGKEKMLEKIFNLQKKISSSDTVQKYSVILLNIYLILTYALQELGGLISHGAVVAR